jgi:hypothetical protein
MGLASLPKLDRPKNAMSSHEQTQHPDALVERVRTLGLRMNAPGSLPVAWYRRNAVAYPLVSYATMALAAFLSGNGSVASLFALRAAREFPRVSGVSGTSHTAAIQGIHGFLEALAEALQGSPSVSPEERERLRTAFLRGAA